MHVNFLSISFVHPLLPSQLPRSESFLFYHKTFETIAQVVVLLLIGIALGRSLPEVRADTDLDLPDEPLVGIVVRVFLNLWA